ncbi:shikimate dehydrogenase [Limimaricola soesokkakensis]|uniref:Shikimate dehydrogenase n=1 Tax=Limimaricola soesokkakensis TaxID=1343159 RepID=A0A1X7A646_9RHOB|nr:shikimate dehydrogenase [Limimaricola soesokkakensis]PSK80537.1 shikimate dehydrogenase [Limimaricola soesokkakensis]SLN71238.1 Quinate/shikimate dehydrogenase [Limimaricola soesokkakensis]
MPGDTLRLGLIGDNIRASRSPLLHRIAGEMLGIPTVYDSLIPAELGRDFDAVFADCATTRAGINVTYPYKEVAARKVTVDDPLVRGIGAVNTVLFAADRAKGHNTDFTGFKAAHARVRGAVAPGRVLMIGTGGVGRAVAFGLAGLGATALRLVDRDRAKAETLAAELRAAAPAMMVEVAGDAEAAARGCDGLINCTPLGMVGYPGTPLPRAAMAGAAWAFDAVYTPEDTQFLTDAAAEGLQIISGWELYFYQGVHASRLFTGRSLDEDALRARLRKD